jgi:hypothetical protein
MHVRRLKIPGHNAHIVLCGCGMQNTLLGQLQLLELVQGNVG